MTSDKYNNPSTICVIPCSGDTFVLENGDYLAFLQSQNNADRIKIVLLGFSHTIIGEKRGI